MPPLPIEAMTRSPTLKRATPSPSSFTTPAISAPGAKGKGGLNWYLFSMISTSGKLTPQALTWIAIWPGPGLGEGTSLRTSISGGPYSLQSMAFMKSPDVDGRP